MKGERLAARERLEDRPSHAAIAADEPEEPNEGLLRDAESVDQYLRLIRRLLLRAYAEDTRRANLTVPQVQALAALARSLGEDLDGLTIRDLSQRMGLAQSTVSSLVERLERKQLVRRLVDASDRRRTRVVLAEAVKSYLQQTRPGGRLSPLLIALQMATEEERKGIVDGLAVLHRLLTAM